MSKIQRMPHYQSHKVVEAAKIVEVVRTSLPSTQPAEFDIGVEGAEDFIHVTSGPIVHKLPSEMLGGYLVRYEDGYMSWSPADVFEAAYQPIDAMSFGHAIAAMKSGHKVARAGWNGKGMWIAIGAGNPALPDASFWNPHARAFAAENGGTAEVLPYILFKTADGKILMGWLASHSDMLADDWLIVEPYGAPAT